MDINLPKLIFETAEYLYKIWKRIPKTEIINQEATINIPEAIVDYSLAVKIPPNFRSIRKSIKFDAPSIIRASAASFSPTPQSIRRAIKKNPSGEGYVLYPRLLSSNAEYISLSFSYKIDDISLIDDLVQRNTAHEPSGSERNEYWMNAQLKHPKILVNKFGRFDLRDVDVTVAVAVHNELKTTIPSPFIKRLKIFYDLLSEKDPRQQFKALPALRRLAKQKTSSHEFDIFKDLDTIFLPNEFSKFVKVLKDFRYSTCYRGRAYYEFPIQMIPKKMGIVSRTDLTLEKPASEGILIYQRNLFIEALNGVFSKY